MDRRAAHIMVSGGGGFREGSSRKKDKEGGLQAALFVFLSAGSLSKSPASRNHNVGGAAVHLGCGAHIGLVPGSAEKLGFHRDFQSARTDVGFSRSVRALARLVSHSR